MRFISTICLCIALGVLVIGCAEKKPFDGAPTVPAFTGRVVQNGKPVSFPPGRNVQLKLIHEKAQSFGIPLETDGTFKIGWMPIGKYSVMVVRQPAGGKGGPQMYNVPGQFEIVNGKTEYEVELGKNWK